MTRPGKNWLCLLVFMGVWAVGAAVRGQPAASSGARTSLRLSDEPTNVPDTPVGAQAPVSPEASAQGAAPRTTPTQDGKRDRGPTVVTPPPGVSRQNPGRGVFGVDPRNYAVPNPLHDGQAGARRPTGTSAGPGESNEQPRFGSDGKPRPAPQSRTSNDPTSAVRMGTKPTDRTGIARSSTPLSGKAGVRPEQAARIEQPKPQSWWNKLNPFRKGSQPARGETASSAPRTGLMPSSADATRRAFDGLSQQSPGKPTPHQAKTEWAFGKRFSSVPTTPTASRTEPDTEGKQ
ncbi:MAG: hypothetical protein NTY19_38900 [Planctomycetota bacterium]|nr:hypothetical protein [Planctomycetota bacterium]